MKTFLGDKVFFFSILGAMTMVAVEVPVWVAIFALSCILYKVTSEVYSLPKISKFVTGLLSLAILAVVLVQFKTLVGQDPAYTFLLGLTGLKILDYQTIRDRKFLVLLGFVLLAVKALFTVDVYWFLPTFTIFAGLWLSLLPTDFVYKKQVLLRVFTFALPLALALFFLFPRVVFPWAVNQVGIQGQIGFSDWLSPGNVAELASRNELVLRAQFFNIKITSPLYWRGSVLTVSEGLSWQPRRMETVPLEVNSAGLWDFQVTLEPQAKRFLFVPENTVGVQLDGQNHLALRGQTFRATSTLNSALVYRGWMSTSGANPKDKADDILKAYLQMPTVGEKTQKLLQSLRSKSGSVEGGLQALQEFFEKDDFQYTLRPGAYLGENPLEQFLFDRKKGFCEHFAGAYATLARGLGIPSRVVVGYQGGKYNEVGDFWSINQNAAHAWVEVWHQGQWQTVDPTRWIAPLRFEMGPDDFFALSLADQLTYAKQINWRPARASFLEWMEQVSFFIENINYQWTSFIIDYDRQSQLNVLIQFALTTVFSSRGLIVLVLFILGGTVWLFWRTSRKTSSMIYRFQRLEKKLQKEGIEREVAEGPVTFLQRLQASFPDQQDFYQKFQQMYEQEVYQEK